ncbi:MAG: PDZ domain-containing protein, partial [Gemmataceae bacterium]
VDAAAAKAGLRAGDVVTRVGELPVGCSLDVQRALLDVEAGAKVPVLIRRDGADRKAELVLEAVVRADPRAALASAQTPSVWRSLGMKLGPLPNAAEVMKAHPRLNGGLLITEVRSDGPAAKAGLRGGDVLVGLQQWEMLSLDNVNFVLTHPERSTFTPMQFYILRGGQVHRGGLTPGE